MSTDYDVIVVGAGPAGIPAAIKAAEKGVKTLLIEKNETIMAKKPCGEATSIGTFRDVGIDPKPYIVLHKVIPRVYAPNGKYIDIGFAETYSINKTMYLQELALKAAENGAHIRVREPVEAVSRDDGVMKVKTKYGVYRAKVVIGADGYHSIVAKSLGVREKSEPIPTLIYLMANVKLDEPDIAYFYLGSEVAPKGYAWIFPKSEKVAEVGVGVRGGSAKYYLDKFVKDHSDWLGDAQVIDYRGAPVPIGGMISKPYGDGFMLVGDAAGTVMPLTGAGMHPSGVAGLVAGETAADAVLEGDTSEASLGRWVKRYEDPWGKKIRYSLKAMRFLEKLSDEELNKLADVLEPDDIVKIANGEDVMGVVRRLLKAPGVAFKLAKAIVS